jgi:uncharacterized protein YndB with AHSA1/START domain
MNTRIEPGIESPERVLVITRVFNAPPRLVFKAWTKPEHVIRWWGPKDFTLPFCEMDFRPGGEYRFCMRSPEGTDHWVWGIYREILEPERLAFTWTREDAVGRPINRTLVTLTFVEHEGKTQFTLHQAIFDTVEDRNDHRGGWSECLDRLGSYVGSQPE